MVENKRMLKKICVWREKNNTLSQTVDNTMLCFNFLWRRFFYYAIFSGQKDGSDSNIHIRTVFGKIWEKGEKNMNLTAKKTEYTMEKTGDSFTFSVKERNDYCVVKINYISEKGASVFLDTLKSFDVRACQLTATAEDMALSSVTELLREVL